MNHDLYVQILSFVMKENKVNLEQSVSEREQNANGSSVIDLNTKQPHKISRQQGGKMKAAIFYLITLGIVLLVGTLIWSEQRKNTEETSVELTEVRKQLEEAQKKNVNHDQQVQQLQTKLFQIQRQYDEHLKNEKSLSARKQTQNTAAQPGKVSPVQKGNPNSDQNTSTNPEAPKENKNNFEESKREGYIVNENKPQQGGIKKGHQGTVSTITFLSRNARNQSVDQVLYKTPEIRTARKEFHQERKKFLQKYRQFDRLNLVQFNNKIDNSDNETERRRLDTAYRNADQVHRISQYKDELPFCILIPSYRNNARFRIQYNLNSIFTQNYSNYYAVITNDASDDGSDQVYRNYFTFYSIPSDKYIYINNPTKKGAMENDYNANHKYCSEDAISLHLDGDDELIGRNVLKIFNAEYQRRKAGALYSNFYFYSQNRYSAPGFTSQFPDSVKKLNQYKSHPMRYSHLKSYRNELFRKLDKSNFVDASGKFVGFASDVAIYLPIMEVSCERVYKIEGFHYLYNTQTGNNEDTISRAKQVEAEYIARGKPKLKCDEQFRKKMEAIP